MEDGTFYMEPGVGRTMGGLHVQDLMRANKISHIADWVQREISETWAEISDNARILGYHFKQPVSLKLFETAPYQYWDILEPETCYVFRISVM